MSGDDDSERQARQDQTAAARSTRALQKATRRRNEAAKIANRQTSQVFAVRFSAIAFGWEIRHLGGIVKHRSVEGYPSPTLAVAAGESALAALPSTDAA